MTQDAAWLRPIHTECATEWCRQAQCELPLRYGRSSCFDRRRVLSVLTFFLISLYSSAFQQPTTISILIDWRWRRSMIPGGSSSIDSRCAAPSAPRNNRAPSSGRPTDRRKRGVCARCRALPPARRHLGAPRRTCRPGARRRSSWPAECWSPTGRSDGSRRTTEHRGTGNLASLSARCSYAPTRTGTTSSARCRTAAQPTSNSVCSDHLDFGGISEWLGSTVGRGTLHNFTPHPTKEEH